VPGTLEAAGSRPFSYVARLCPDPRGYFPDGQHLPTTGPSLHARNNSISLGQFSNARRSGYWDSKFTTRCVLNLKKARIAQAHMLGRRRKK
jgi:hypothetical protein